MSVNTISPAELKDTLASGNCTLVDVRTPAEFRELHVRGAVNLPLERISLDSVPKPGGDEPLYVICQKGGRGAQACQKLISAGLENVINVDGGTLACRDAGLPVVEGKKTISLERQVRIAAGLLVILGVVLGATVSEYFYALSAFVGAGLTFAGITDTCGMGMLLARMPWNQAGCDSGCSTQQTKQAA
jgi:rhodanese-related sulfurtransferase